MKLKLNMSTKLEKCEKEMLDFSNYSTKSIYYNDSNKLVPGKMKDESGSFVLKNVWNWSHNIVATIIQNG